MRGREWSAHSERLVREAAERAKRGTLPTAHSPFPHYDGAACLPLIAWAVFVVRRSGLVILAWAVVIAIALPLAPRVSEALRAGGSSATTSSPLGRRRCSRRELGAPPSALVVAFHSDQLTAGTPPFETAAAAAMRDIPTAPHVQRVISHLLQPRQVSADGHTAYDVVFLDLPADDSPDALPILRERLHPAPGLDVELAGGPAFYGDVQTVSANRDLRRSEVISLPLAALALLLVFGSVVAAGVPLVVGGTTRARRARARSSWSLGHPDEHLRAEPGDAARARSRRRLLAAVHQPVPRGARQTAARTIRQRRVDDAVRITVATAGRAVFFSGLTVLLGLLGLVLFEFMILRSVGIAGAIVVGLAGLAALTLLPALLDVVRPRTSTGSRSGASAARPTPRVRGRASPAGHARAGRGPRPDARRCCSLLGSPFLHVRFNSPDATILPPSVPSRAAFDRLRRRSARASSRRSRSRSGRTARRPRRRTSAALYDYSRRIAADPARHAASTASSTSTRG